MLRRQALAILGDTYRWMQEHRAKRASFPWPVKCELRMLIALGPWMSTNLETPWLRQVFATDASMEGYGVVSTPAKVAEILSEARLAETTGWTVCLDDDYNDIEESTWSEPAHGYSADTFEESLSSAPALQKAGTELPRVFRVAHLFGGHRRHGDLERWLRTLAVETGIRVEVWSIDVSIDPTLDLTRNDIVELLSIAFRAGFFHAAVAGPPCSTWSRARFRGGGPRPLRTRAEPWGRTDIAFTDGEKKKLVLGTKFLIACIKLFGVLAEEGGIFILEHPRDPGGPPFPSIWDLELTKELRSKSGASLTDLDQCMFGQEAQKGTFIMSNADTAPRHLDRRCCHSNHAVVLTGQNTDGSFRTAAAQTYPSGLCRAIAATILDSLQVMQDNKTGPDAQVQHPNIETLKFPPAVPGRARAERRYGERLPVPPLSGQWLPANRWSLVYKGLWRNQEHITVQEMRTAVGVLRHLPRSRPTWNQKVLILMDPWRRWASSARGDQALHRCFDSRGRQPRSASSPASSRRWSGTYRRKSIRRTDPPAGSPWAQRPKPWRPTRTAWAAPCKRPWHSVATRRWSTPAWHCCWPVPGPARATPEADHRAHLPDGEPRRIGAPPQTGEARAL